MEPWRAFTLGMMVAAFLSLPLVGGVVAMRDDAWQKQLVGRGFAHYDSASSWHWNSER